MSSTKTRSIIFFAVEKDVFVGDELLGVQQPDPLKFFQVSVGDKGITVIVS